ncbi:MAG: hypothetical protein LBM73_02485, partial [Candidatus Nomurabacteria bacterium]|nr:hypothetical protein [Candidatus Nomurabacteria bacterium]
AQKGVVATQFPAPQVEELGLLKMDFLGLSNLTIIDDAIRIVEKVYHQKVDLSNLPLDDRRSFALFQNGETTGVFQFESAGMKRYLKQLHPTEFSDLIAMVALYRPGPMQFIDSFIKRRHNEEPITYLHPKMENALKQTYGILVYQEQFMQISKDLSGFSGGQADTLRKAVSKKKAAMMAKIKPEFIDGALSRNADLTRDTMEQFWTQLEEFANYCFNKSHAACYALVAYWTAFIKAHWPAAFMAALMTSDHGNTDRLSIEIGECQRMGIKVANPDINESFVEFSVVEKKDSAAKSDSGDILNGQTDVAANSGGQMTDKATAHYGGQNEENEMTDGEQKSHLGGNGQSSELNAAGDDDSHLGDGSSFNLAGTVIRFGLGAVKGVGGAVIDEILRARSNGAFTSIEDFARRVSSRIVNKRVWESLIMSGAFDQLMKVKNNDEAAAARSDLLFNLESILAFAQKVQKDAASGQADLLSMLGADERANATPALKLSPAPTKHSDTEMLGWERELLGLYLSAHPLDKYDVYFREQTNALRGLNSDQDGAACVIGGILNRLRVIQTKSGSKMAFAAVEDKTGSSEVVIFPKTYESLPESCAVGAVVKIAGRISGTDKEGNRLADPSVMADTIEVITDDVLRNYQSTGVDFGEVDLASAKKRGRKTNQTGQRFASRPKEGKTLASAPERPTEAAGESLAGETSGQNYAENTLRSSDSNNKSNKAGSSKKSAAAYQPASIDAPKKLYIHIKDPSDTKKLLKMKDELKKFAGDQVVILVLGDGKMDALRLPFNCGICDDLTQSLGEIYGADCVVVK